MKTRTKSGSGKSLAISSEVATLIRKGTWSETTDGQVALSMPVTSDRKLYQVTAKFLMAAGGRWSRRAKATIFDDTDAEAAISEACQAGFYVNPKQLYQFFETPREIADRMATSLQLRRGATVRILEPSVGNGALISAVSRACEAVDADAEIVAVDLDPQRLVTLRAVVEGLPRVTVTAYLGDFLEMTSASRLPRDLFDAVIMNPPFSGGQDVQHVMRAYSLLKPAGRLIAVMSPGFTYRQTSVFKDFSRWLDALSREAITNRYEWLPEGAFKAAGTSVRTVLLSLLKTPA